jgi:hypothetical protein
MNLFNVVIVIQKPSYEETRAPGFRNYVVFSTRARGRRSNTKTGAWGRVGYLFGGSACTLRLYIQSTVTCCRRREKDRRQGFVGIKSALEIKWKGRPIEQHDT